MCVYYVYMYLFVYIYFSFCEMLFRVIGKPGTYLETVMYQLDCKCLHLYRHLNLLLLNKVDGCR